MNRLSKCIALVVAVGVTACGERNTPPPELPAPPTIKSFSADKSRINAGETVTLTFTVENATEVTLLDDAGAKVAFEGDASDGTAQVQPSRTSFYVLRAIGEGGRDSNFVQVAVSEDLKEVFLVAVPPEVDSGSPSLLLWSAHQARAAKVQSSVGQELPLNAAAGSGTLEVAPSRTAAYTLVASGVDASQTLTETAEIRVRPVIDAFAFSAGAAKVDESLTATWQTRGAGQVVLTEATFGELTRANFPQQTAQVDDGTHTFTIPSTLPSGEPVQDGYPLQFTLTVTQMNPAVTLTRTFNAHVGEGPKVVSFTAPSAITEGKTFDLSWATQNATRVQLFAGSALIYEPLPTQQAEVAQGSITLKAPPQDTTYTLRAFSHLGAEASADTLLRVVELPQIDAFTLPASTNAPGTALTASWTTQNATGAVLRVKHGPNVALITENQVASGSAQVYPGQDTVFVLEAFNDAGDVVRAEQQVSVLGGPPSLTAGPTPVTSGELITVAWDLPAALATRVIGDPQQPSTLTNPHTDWLDLNVFSGAEPLQISDAQDGVAELPLTTRFRFPFVNAMHDRFFVSVNGFVAFSPVAGMPDNVALDGSEALPPMIAPYWDDLELGSGKVMWVVEGQSFPRRLIIQWDGVRTATDDQSVLSFQVHLWETGEFKFIYDQLDGQDAQGQNASVGWRVAEELSEETAASGAAALTPFDQRSFFGFGAVTGTYDYVGQRAGAVYAFAVTTNGNYVPFSARVNVLVPGSVVINEAMILPDTSAFEGQWVEFHNTTDVELDLSGTTLVSLNTETEWLLPEGATLPPGGFLVAAQSTDPFANGGVTADLAWHDFTIDTAGGDTLLLTAGGNLDEVGFILGDLVAGTSWQRPDTSVLTASGAGFVCTLRVETFNQNGGIGTPGGPNEVCFPYVLSQIPVNYRDISADGVALFSSSFGDVGTSVNISEAPFPYFGQAPATTMRVSDNGWIDIGATHSSSAYSNRTTPGSGTEPVGAIAPFWDDLQYTSIAGSNVYRQRIGPGEDTSAPMGHWIIQWHRLRHYNVSPHDDLNIQAKLFDDGTIEFHYADMVSGTTANYADGNSATIWLEAPDGSSAIAVGRDEPVIKPHSAWRFTPRQPAQP